MTAHATMLSPQQLIDAAKAPFLAYGRKDWKALEASITPDYAYDEVATNRKVKGLDEVLAVFRGWATAFPDSTAKFHSALVSGNMVVIEVTWHGTHTGPLATPTGPIAATGKRIEWRACNVIEIDAETGKPKMSRQYNDMGTLLQQLGITS